MAAIDIIKNAFFISLGIIFILIIFLCYFLRNQNANLERKVNNLQDIVRLIIDQTRGQADKIGELDRKVGELSFVRVGGGLPAGGQTKLAPIDEAVEELETTEYRDEEEDEDEEDGEDEEEDEDEDEEEGEGLVELEDLIESEPTELFLHNYEEHIQSPSSIEVLVFHSPAQTHKTEHEFEILPDVEDEENVPALEEDDNDKDEDEEPKPEPVAIETETQQIHHIYPDQSLQIKDDDISIIKVSEDTATPLASLSVSTAETNGETYRKMSVHQLKQVVITKGLATNVHKLKRDDLLKIILEANI